MAVSDCKVDRAFLFITRRSVHTSRKHASYQRWHLFKPKICRQANWWHMRRDHLLYGTIVKLKCDEPHVEICNKAKRRWGCWSSRINIHVITPGAACLRAELRACDIIGLFHLAGECLQNSRPSALSCQAGPTCSRFWSRRKK